MFPDEATFHVSGKVNEHNVRIKGTQNLYEVRKHMPERPKLNMWCAIPFERLIGPFFP